MIYDLIIIGAGASGCMAAITSSNLGINALLLEQNDRIGKKILITGNGRCNISNSNNYLSNYHSTSESNETLLKNVLNSFKPSNTTEFFYTTIGLPIITIENNKMFPLSLQASSVVDLIKLTMEERSLAIEYNCKIKNINIKNGVYNISSNDRSFFAKKVLLCTGGSSYASTGSDGNGYNIAKALGHSIIPPTPSLVQLKLNFNKLKAISGVRFQGACEIFIDNISKRRCLGELLFTDYGISGPPVLQLSRFASMYASSKRVALKVDFFPNMTYIETKDFFNNHWALFSYRSLYNSLIGIIHKKLIPVFLKDCSIDNIHKEVYTMSWEEKLSIIDNFKGWTFDVIGTNPFSNAQVTCGGVDTSEINPKTLESSLVDNLYFAGEVIDVDGDCGGFNLQWAWASAFVAVNSIKRSLA